MTGEQLSDAFSDEGEIELHSRRRQHVRRRPGRAPQPNMVQPTREFSPALIVWGAVGADGVRVLCRCEGNADQYMHHDILDQHLGSIASGRYIIQQDGASCSHCERCFNKERHRNASTMESFCIPSILPRAQIDR